MTVVGSSMLIGAGWPLLPQLWGPVRLTVEGGNFTGQVLRLLDSFYLVILILNFSAEENQNTARRH